MTFRWIDNKLVDIEDKPKMNERWLREDKLFVPGDQVVILDKRGYKDDIGYSWKDSMNALIGKKRTVAKQVINYYGYCVGYRLKNCAGIFNPDFLKRKETKKK